MLRWCCTYWFIGGTYVYKRCYQQDQLGSLQNRNSFGHLDNLCTAACSHWIPHTHRYLKIYKNWIISRNLLIQHEFSYYEIEWNGCNDNRVVRNQSETKELKTNKSIYEYRSIHTQHGILQFSANWLLKIHWTIDPWNRAAHKTQYTVYAIIIKYLEVCVFKTNEILSFFPCFLLSSGELAFSFRSWVYY